MVFLLICRMVYCTSVWYPYRIRTESLPFFAIFMIFNQLGRRSFTESPGEDESKPKGAVAAAAKLAVTPVTPVTSGPAEVIGGQPTKRGFNKLTIG